MLPFATCPLRSDVGIDWDNLGFGIRPTDSMWVATCPLNGTWNYGGLQKFGDLMLSPSASVLNYGQGVFEGLKAHRVADGRILLFRVGENAVRMQKSAARMGMPEPPEDLFVEAVLRTVGANAAYIPPPGKGSLYIRPLLIGSGAILGLAPSPMYSLLVYVSPVGPYFKGLQLTPIDLKVEETYHRAAPGGTGEAKTVGNYAAVLMVQQAAKKAGFSDVLFLDAKEDKYCEEVSSCNIFCVKNKKIATPSLVGTVLRGVTRKSIITLAQQRGYAVEEKMLSVDELMDADEVFVTGTAVVLSPVGSLTYKGKKVTFLNKEPGPVALELYKALTDVQTGKAPDHNGWVVELPKDYIMN
eukprot:jgi/Mesvir1/18745/Mv01253-RA.1